MVLQKMVQQHGKELSYLGGQMRKAGYLDEVKSILSEFMQYDIRDSEIQEMIEDSGDRALLQMKLKDVAVLYQAFTGYLKDHYMTGEEVMDALEKLFRFTEKMKTVYFFWMVTPVLLLFRCVSWENFLLSVKR